MRKFLLIAGIVLCVLGLTAGYFAYKLFGSACTNEQPVEIRVHGNYTFNDLAGELQSKAGLKDTAAFIAWVKRLGYTKVRACFISIPPKASISEVAKILKANRTQTRNIVIKGGWNASNLAEVVSANIEVEPDSLLAFLNSTKRVNQYGWTDTTWPAFFIPNTYNFFVADDLAAFLKRMHKEYEKFWGDVRLQKANAQGLDRMQVAIVASIVSKESNMTAEYENIAGVYINRLRKNMFLQADPTVVFARGKVGRVWSNDLKIQSPYNTYVHKGLPPGPICIPNVAAYDAVLNYTHHNYLYFCAKPDFSGYHNFASTWAEHIQNAQAFHRALDGRGK